MPSDALAAIPAVLFDPGGILRDAMLRSPGSSQGAFLARSGLSPEACAVATEAAAMLAAMGERIESARFEIGCAESGLYRLREVLKGAAESEGKAPGRVNEWLRGRDELRALVLSGPA